MEFSPLLIAVAGMVALLVLVLAVVVSRYKVAGPNEAFIVTGRRSKDVRGVDGRLRADLSGQKVVTGGGVFVWPFVQQRHTMDLRARRISVQIRGAVSSRGSN